MKMEWLSDSVPALTALVSFLAGLFAGRHSVPWKLTYHNEVHHSPPPAGGFSQIQFRCLGPDEAAEFLEGLASSSGGCRVHDFVNGVCVLCGEREAAE